MSKKVSTLDEYSELLKLLNDFKVSYVTQRSVIGTVEKNLNWVDKNSKIIHEFLEFHFNSGKRLKIPLIILIFGVLVQLF